jgi:hypothetical protein
LKVAKAEYLISIVKNPLTLLGQCPLYEKQSAGSNRNRVRLYFLGFGLGNAFASVLFSFLLPRTKKPVNSASEYLLLNGQNFYYPKKIASIF